MKPKDPFEILLHRYNGLLFTLCRHFSRKGVEADDLLQDASVALWRDSERLLSLSTGPQQAALVWRISRNAMIDTLRRTREYDSLSEEYDSAADDRNLMNELHERIELLDEPDRSIVKLQLEGYNYEEIAERTGLTVKNVSVRLVRVKDKLRSYFK
ncbi:MAG: sigma-70 family RNA polymerase sigma factor [Bacteroidales bacterium]|nr:sigma-70 family RNA polymerase sigma factor [Bacteroidales bacterium]